MKRVFYLALLVLLSSLLISFFLKREKLENPNNILKDISVNDDYTNYYEIIREAWGFHKPNKDYPNAFKKYREAFNCVSSPLAIDVFDALRIAIEVDSVELMFLCSEILVKKGCSYRFFERKGLEKLKNYSSEWKRITELIDEVQANPSQYWNVE